MEISGKEVGDAFLQLPFSGLGISLKACADAAGKMQIRFSEKPVCECRLNDIFVDTAFTGFSGYELLLTLGREIRGR
ncbi:hypothetical protein [Maridesulfovibrio zosterae]|uniref:hypothetical protein n=1 Tax=Maridesulfovibrio zosterae TaxID=82171 RepID=UPI00040AA8EB|nr:hypothetical protein [Maridesulfovibrio zosterae]